MANTPNFDLYKPNRTDSVDVDTSLANNFTKIDTALKENKDNLETHGHESDKIAHADGSVRDVLDNHEVRITDGRVETSRLTLAVSSLEDDLNLTKANLEVEHEAIVDNMHAIESIDSRVTDIEVLGIDKLAPNLEGRIATLESDIEGVNAPTTFAALDAQNHTMDQLRTGYVDNKLAPFESKVSTIESQLAQKAKQIDLETEKARINNLVANAGNTDGNAELLDTRIGKDGTTYPTVGEAVRGQIGNLSDILEDSNIFNIHQIKEFMDVKEVYQGNLSLKYNQNQSWKFAKVVAPIGVGTYTVFVDSFNLSTQGSFSIRATDTQVNYLDTYKFSNGKYVVINVYDDGTYFNNSITLVMQVTLADGSTVPFDTYFLKGIRIYEGDLTKKQVLSDENLGLDKYVKNKKNKIIRQSIQTLTGDTVLSIPSPNIKQKQIGFSAKVSTLGALTVSNGKNKSYYSAYMEITATQVKIYKYTTAPVLVETFNHGLTIKDYIIVNINQRETKNADFVITTNGNFYKNKATEWNGSDDSVAVSTTGGSYTNAELSFGSREFELPVWAFGDSYFDMWTQSLSRFGVCNFLLDSYSGRGSAVAIQSLQSDLEFYTPKKVLWCMGMNDADSTTVNSAWNTAFNTLKKICTEHHIELVLCTIPTTPTRTHIYKNAIIRNSGYPFIDLEKAVTSTPGVWYEGMLAPDNVHPSWIGEQVIAAKMVADMPELVK